MSTIWLGMLLGFPHFEVAGWGGIYSHQPSCRRWGRLLAMGAPDSPVRRHVTQPLGLGVRRLLELCLLVAPDSPMPHRTGTVYCPVRL
jgi:hypothetical protein